MSNEANEPNEAELNLAEKIVDFANRMVANRQTFGSVEIAHFLAAHRADSESELAKAKAESESRRKVVMELEYNNRKLWARAENAEAQRDELAIILQDAMNCIDYRTVPGPQWQQHARAALAALAAATR